jgi:hypothetical protein
LRHRLACDIGWLATSAGSRHRPARDIGWLATSAGPRHRFAHGQGVAPASCLPASSRRTIRSVFIGRRSGMCMQEDR